MADTLCSIIEKVYNMPELKSCPIETTFKIIGKRWTVLIIREILRGHRQFNRFMENIEGITPKVLTERLRELERLGGHPHRVIGPDGQEPEHLLGGTINDDAVLDPHDRFLLHRGHRSQRSR